MDLPKGIALVRVERPGMRIVAVSPKLNETQAFAAKVLAAALASGGSPYVMLSMADVLAAIHDAVA